MKHTLRALIPLWLACLPLFAQENVHERLHDALVLEQQGQFAAAGEAARQVTESNQCTGVELGRAYVMLSLAYRAQGMFAAAQNASEQSLRILAPDSAHPGDYASALENLAGLYGEIGRLDLAHSMWIKALHLRQQTGDHIAVMESLSNLVTLALAQKHMHEARRLAQQASDEMKLAGDLTDDDRMVFFESQGLMALADKHPSAAVTEFQHALELSLTIHGAQHWLTGWEYVLCGKAYTQSGDGNQALENMRKGIAILDHALGHDNPKYLVAEIAYSQALDRAGFHV
jgi:tetratricopeptide (TPR) repeat protein